jgi:GcrA cell cycle regulator
MPAIPANTWNDDNTAQLRVLWEEGLTVSEIRRRLSITENAVIGILWRLAWPSRREAQTIRPLPRSRSRKDECFWPIGHLETRGFRFCGQPAVASKPYCEAHRRRVLARRGKWRPSAMATGYRPFARQSTECLTSSPSSTNLAEFTSTAPPPSVPTATPRSSTVNEKYAKQARDGLSRPLSAVHQRSPDRLPGP